jgi:diketogulonate reductase-like aldo/keto reductase
LKATTLPREEIWITTKVVHSLSDPVAYIKKTLDQFGLQYFDCVLIHTPFKFTKDVTLETTWAKMEEMQSLGLARYIGVSNFRKCDLEAVVKIAKVQPYINQCENHPYVQHQQEELQAYMRQKNVKWASYAPLASITRSSGGPVDSVVSQVAQKYGKPESQVLLRWQIEQGHIALTTSGKVQRMKEQLQAMDFVLNKADVEAITEAGRGLYYRAFFKEEIDAVI